MKTESLLKGLAEITYTPITCFHKTASGLSISYSYPKIPYAQNLVQNFPASILNTKRKVKIQIAEQLLFFGYIWLSENSFIILGPVIEIPMDNQIAGFILRKMNLPLTQTKELLNYYENTPHFTIYKFAKICSFINKVLNDDTLSTHEILPEEYSFSKQEASEEYAPSKTENKLFRNSEQFENELYSYVTAGQYAKINEFAKQISFDGDIGNLSHSAMQQNKYLVLSSVVLASRAAYYGGVVYDTAMEQADFFIRKIDQAVTIKDLIDIHKNMLLSFTKLVAERKLGKPSSAIFYKVQNYIIAHLTEKITTDDIANALELNRSYLSSHFKKETGINLIDYINMLKIDEAKRLLTTTDKTLIYIANTLCFSSQSYFQATFKKIVGCTPKEYRSSSVNRFANN